MDAQCTGCNGRVMPYRQYVFHFKPTAACESCGRLVRLRHFARVLMASVAALASYSLFIVVARSVALIAVGMALAVLVALLADFWTYRNLRWDPVDGLEDAPGP